VLIMVGLIVLIVIVIVLIVLGVVLHCLATAACPNVIRLPPRRAQGRAWAPWGHWILGRGAQAPSERRVAC
jgi:hypothetical protein